MPIIDSAEPLLIGCFDAICGKGKAYIIVNGTDLEENKTINFKVKFNDAAKATAFYFGKPTELTFDENGFCDITLESGQGVLVTVD